jgi:hypothetical protein
MTTAQINPYPDVPPPAGAHVRTDWEEWSSDGQSRIIAGTERRVKGLEICTCALQAPHRQHLPV